MKLKLAPRSTCDNPLSLARMLTSRDTRIRVRFEDPGGFLEKSLVRRLARARGFEHARDTGRVTVHVIQRVWTSRWELESAFLYHNVVGLCRFCTSEPQYHSSVKLKKARLMEFNSATTTQNGQVKIGGLLTVI